MCIYVYVCAASELSSRTHSTRLAPNIRKHYINMLDPEFLPVPPLFKLDLLIHDYVSSD